MKYYLSLCCIIKDERNLEEFIIYHHVVGVEHFYIYDNESSLPIKERLNSYFYKKICTIIDYPGKKKQLDAYNDCIKKVKDETVWLIVCDGDEYIVPKKKNYWSVRDFLNEYEYAHAIGINWVLFGTSFYETKQDGYIIDKYRYCSGQNKHIKTICKPLYTICFKGAHDACLLNPNKYIDAKGNIINGAFNENYTIDVIQINHYHFKSAEEIIEKYNRGNADSNLKIYVPENPHEFDNDIKIDFIADKYLDSVKSIHKITGVNWKIYKALNPDLEKLLEDNEIEYNEHIIYHANEQKRHLHITDKYPDFKKDYYRMNYDDLIELDDLNLELHYIKIGSLQNRICNRNIYLFNYI